LLPEAASAASDCHLRTTSFATGRRWYAETRAAEATEGFLSTMHVLTRRSMAWTVEASMTRHRARIALGRYTTSLPTEVSFMMDDVTMMTSSAEPASSLMTR
jgi:hypothetical protein